MTDGVHRFRIKCSENELQRLICLLQISQFKGVQFTYLGVTLSRRYQTSLFGCSDRKKACYFHNTYALYLTAYFLTLVISYNRFPKCITAVTCCNF